MLLKNILLKRLLNIILLYISLVLLLSNCKYDRQSAILGTWFTDSLPGRSRGFAEIRYIFTKDSIINTATVHGHSNDTFRFAYKLKSSADTLILEAFHPVMQITGDFKIYLFDHNLKMSLITPDNNSIELSKQEK
ncbi:MAG: hypothetical protein ACP5P3_01780 [Ignavibacteria bacterium]